MRKGIKSTITPQLQRAADMERRGGRDGGAVRTGVHTLTHTHPHTHTHTHTHRHTARSEQTLHTAFTALGTLDGGEICAMLPPQGGGAKQGLVDKGTTHATGQDDCNYPTLSHPE